MKTPLEIRELLVNEIYEGDYLKRTLEGLASNTGISIDIVEKTLIDNPDIFTKITGCKGKMWILNDNNWL